MRKLELLTLALMLFAGAAMAAGSNLAWNDCLGGGGVPDRTVSCTNSGSGFVYVSLNPSQSYPNVAAIDAYIDVAPAVTIGSWWNTVPTTTRFGSSVTEPASGACPAWWAAAPSGAITFQPPQAPVNSQNNTMRLLITSIVAAGEEQPMEPGTEYFVGALELKFNTGTFDNAECNAGASIRIASYETCQPGGSPHCSLRNPAIMILQPGQTDHREWEVDVSNCVTFRNPPTKQCPGATPTEKSTWGSIKALYR